MMIVYYFALALFVLLCFILTFVIMIQESKVTGLGSSFGGDSGDSLFGTSTADVLKRFTGWLALIFLASCVILSIWTSVVGPQVRATKPLLMEEVEG